MEDIQSEDQEELEIDDPGKVIITATIKDLKANKRTGGFTLTFDVPETECVQFSKMLSPSFNQNLHVVIIPFRNT